MNAIEFNKLKNSYYCDKNAADAFHIICIGIIKKRLMYRNCFNDLESHAHSILIKFLSKLPDYYIISPTSYLNKCTDNYLSTLKSKSQRETALTSDISYEQQFEKLEALEFFRELEENLGKLDAILIYSHYIEKISEKQLAKDFNMSYNVVRQRISRSKKKLKIIFGQNVT